jgi:AraC-like DNA-binding protein
LHFQPEDPPKFEPEVPGPEPETMIDQELKKRLMKFMEENKPYLDPELSLQKLARQLGIQANALSRLINDGTGRNFNDFINVYRVQDMMNMLRSGEQKTQTLLGIAFDCGFNSKATFNRAFKKATGLSPREWIIMEGKERSGQEPG